MTSWNSTVQPSSQHTACTSPLGNLPAKMHLIRLYFVRSVPVGTDTVLTVGLRAVQIYFHDTDARAFTYVCNVRNQRGTMANGN